MGRNLQDHLMSGLSASVSPGLSMDPLAMFYPSTWISLATGKGPLTHTGCDAIAFVRTEAQEVNDQRPDIQLHMIAVSLATDRGMVMKDLVGFKAIDPIDPWWQPHDGDDMDDYEYDDVGVDDDDINHDNDDYLASPQGYLPH